MTHGKQSGTYDENDNDSGNNSANATDIMEFLVVANVHAPQDLNVANLQSTTVNVDLATGSGSTLGSGTFDVTNLDTQFAVDTDISAQQLLTSAQPDSNSGSNQVFMSVPPEGEIIGVRPQIQNQAIGQGQPIEISGMTSSLQGTYFDMASKAMSQPITSVLDNNFNTLKSYIDGAFSLPGNNVPADLQLLAKSLNSALQEKVSDMQLTVNQSVQQAAGQLYNLTPANQVFGYVDGSVAWVKSALTNLGQLTGINLPPNIQVTSSLTQEAVEGIVANAIHQIVDGVPLNDAVSQAKASLMPLMAAQMTVTVANNLGTITSVSNIGLTTPPGGGDPLLSVDTT